MSINKLNSGMKKENALEFFAFLLLLGGEKLKRKFFAPFEVYKV